MSTVTIYTNPECTACFAAELRMRRAGIDFEVVDLATDPAALAYVRDQLGHQEAPVTVHRQPGGRIESWSGFRLEKIKQLAATQNSPSAKISHEEEAVSIAVREHHHRPGATPEVA